MATLTVDKHRRMARDPVSQARLELIADDIIFGGAFIGLSSGRGRPLQGGDTFVGVAEARADNTGGAAGAVSVDLIGRGVISGIAVAGATDATDVGGSVYASDDDTLTLTSTGNTLIGKIVGFNADTGDFDVFFRSSLHDI